MLIFRHTIWTRSFAINMSSYDNADLHSFRLKLSEQHYYPHNLDCLLQIQAQKDSENIMFYFKLFDIRPDIPPEYCNYDWLQLHDGNSTKSAYICGIDSKLCGISPSRTKNVYYTRGNFLTLYFKSDEEEKYMGFDMVITRYRYGVCRSDEYACDNGRCIDESLQCYGYNPCGDGSDCKRLHPGYIWTAIVGSISLCLLIINIILCVTVFKMRRQKDKSAEKEPLTDTKAKGRSHRLTSLSSNIAEHTVPKMTKKRSNFDDSGVLCDSNTVPKRQIESSM